MTPLELEGFAGSVLSPRFDGAVATPNFHREIWGLCTSSSKQVAIAAPRGHAKSTAITHVYGLASLLFREKQYLVIVSDTESQAKQFLSDIKMELLENEYIRELFDVKDLIKDTETDIIVQLGEGEVPYFFRVIAKGSEQKIRGLKWRGKRPDLIICDDMENDEVVLNKDRREKIMNWFLGALVPCLSPEGVIRVVGTVLHADSVLQRLIENSDWVSKSYKAHSPNFNSILWPERFPADYWKSKKKQFAALGKLDVYGMEYLNVPVSEDSRYFKKNDLRPIDPIIDTIPQTYNYYIGVDLAISQKERTDYTVFCVGRMNKDNVLEIVEVIRDRMDSYEIVQTFIKLAKKYRPECFVGQTDHIEKSIAPFLKAEMNRTGTYFTLHKVQYGTDKLSNSRSIAARLRGGGVTFDMDADWYSTFEAELLKFPRDRHDDQVDAFSMIGLILNKTLAPDPKQDLLDKMQDEYDEALNGIEEDSEWGSVNLITGY